MLFIAAVFSIFSKEKAVNRFDLLLSCIYTFLSEAIFYQQLYLSQWHIKYNPVNRHSKQ